jgi:hypothetical protein
MREYRHLLMMNVLIITHNLTGAKNLTANSELPLPKTEGGWRGELEAVVETGLVYFEGEKHASDN